MFNLKEKQNKRIYQFECIDSKTGDKRVIQSNKEYVKKQKVKVLNKTYLYTIDWE